MIYLVTENPNLKILLLEKGNPLNKRICPINEKKINNSNTTNNNNLSEGNSPQNKKVPGRLYSVKRKI